MIIKKLILKNIRSYIEEEIIFPNGITLLSGDIGSGKSTALLAIDFALFGIRRGELSGNSLLRNGTDFGYVNLTIVIDNQEVSIKRTLKKTSNGIVQDSGYLTIKDKTQELTPVELKQRVLQILNYPPEMITKKSLIYRYTVYTPQEEMKLILLGEKENRIETLRKVFNIDKYKRIKDNAKIIITEIKQKKKEFLGITFDLDVKKLKLREKETEVLVLKDQLGINLVRLTILDGLIITKKQNISGFEQQLTQLNQLKKELELINFEVKSKKEARNKLFQQLALKEIDQNNLKKSFDSLNLEINSKKEELELQNKNILELNTKINDINVDNLRSSILEYYKTLVDTENESNKVSNEIAIIKHKKKHSEELKENIKNLDSCPLCKQNVSQEHKIDVINREDESLNDLNVNLVKLGDLKKEFIENINKVKLLIESCKAKEVDYKLFINEIASKNARATLLTSDIGLRTKELTNFNDNKNRIENNLVDLKKEFCELDLIINQLEDKKKLIELDMFNLKDIELNFQICKNELDELFVQNKNIELNIAVINKQEETINKEILDIKNEITLKEKVKENLDYYNKLQDWFENFFLSLIDVIEKKVMLKVHIDFNALFQKWFSMLINTDLIKVRLDEEFTPIIEQNGYDLEYENLSGGEKTACALAYRLALNQIINTIVSFINTKDLIILDEPTDGFSFEQLDRIRFVLEELEMNQIIIVSHESKIESFVDNIIRIQKDGHVSKVLL